MSDEKYNEWVFWLIFLGCPALFFGCFIGGLFFDKLGWFGVIAAAIAGVVSGLVAFSFFSSSFTQQQMENVPDV